VSDALAEITDVVVGGQAASVGGGLRTLHEQAPDVVVTDVHFPDGDILPLLTAARRHPAAPKVVVFTRVEGDEHRRRYLDAGATLYLDKRGGLDALEAGVRALSAAWRGRPRPEPPALDRFALLGRIAGGVVHDLANYLLVLNLSLASLEEGLQEAGQGDTLSDARASLDGATRLTRNLLEYARGGTPAPVAVDLAAVVRRTLAIVGRMIPNEVRLVVDVAADLLPVRGVATELEQLLMNLLLNACDAMPHGGELQLALRVEPAGTVTLEVTDTGAGVGAAACASGATTPSSKTGRIGDGLGLGIVRGVAERHGAVLRIEARPGGGTRVRVELVPAR
jgi:signal transduction histidine kinase